jgi:hypothetical protein
MCKEMPAIPVNKKNNRKKWRAEEEERHKGLLTHKKITYVLSSSHVL